MPSKFDEYLVEWKVKYGIVKGVNYSSLSVIININLF